eukprot:TRINITY_DN2095_c0_g1_i1.p2 TRINITY_DN2095_c0_g1~~TRINITY_DN2095_c0_g1_i1.p2  ORF type:complete len:492 (-),score=136.17 TRINITY_DN2095_c0_g1_i1:1526-3001(-)
MSANLRGGARWRYEQNERIAGEFVKASSSAASRGAAAAGLPPPRLSPHPAEEALRLVEARGMCDALCRECVQLGLQRGAPDGAFTRWCFTRMMQVSRAVNDGGDGGNDQEEDPVLPSSPVTDPGLVDELTKAGLTPEAVKQVEKMLADRCRTALQRIRGRRAATLAALAPKVVESTEEEKEDNAPDAPARVDDTLAAVVGQRFGGVTRVVHEHHVVLSFAHDDVSLAVSRHHMDRLYNVFFAGGGSENDFIPRVFCLLARYESLQGDSYQAACPEDVFRFLRTQLGVTHEAFASPLNRSCPSLRLTFSSAFPDVDACFGSVGEFFALSARNFRGGGSIEVNPPFLEEVMLAAVLHILNWLQGADATAATDKAAPLPFSFVVIFPRWDDTPAVEYLRRSKYLRATVALSKREHSYYSGGQHRPGVLEQPGGTVSYTNTLIFVVQNDAGAAKWPFTKQAEAELRAAFRQQQVEPARKRTQDGEGLPPQKRQHR